MSHSNCLSDVELSTYQHEGFLIRESVFTLAELESFRAASERACESARNQSSGGKTYILDNKRFVDIGHLTVQFEHQPQTELVRVIEPVNELEGRFSQLIDDSRLVGPMRSILAVDQLSLWTAKLNLKPAQVGSGFGWHQDSPYWVHDSDHVDQLPNVMVTFDDASLHNGCLQVIRRSHLEGCLAGTDDGSQLGGFFTDPSCFAEQDAVAMEVPAGSLIFFSPHAIHGSGPNRSEVDRRALIVTYQPANFAALKSGQVRNISLSGTGSSEIEAPTSV
ncbi:MAG: hypothetical protein ACI82A_002760 [Candidatus Azotimanducaceae bacterium]|jgi:hypothetical protein